jgi:MFS family permease
MSTPRPIVSLLSLLIVTALASVGTSIFWVGVPFIAHAQYGLSKQANLLLSLASGVTYVIGAFASGRVLRRVEHHLSPRAAIVCILVIQGIVCMVPLMQRSILALCLMACGVNLLSSFLWPVVESYLTAGRHGARMRSAIGWFNLVWTFAVAAAMVAMSPFMSDAVLESMRAGSDGAGIKPDQVIILSGVLMWFGAMAAWRFPRTPSEHTYSTENRVPDVYPYLLRSARTLLPLSYVMIAAMVPLLPYRIEKIGLDGAFAPPLAAVWMFTRPVAMTLMWRLGAWHGRWGTLVFACIAMTIGFGLIVAGSSLTSLIAGQIIFGAGVGAIYFASLYYAMAVGSAAVDAGGTHEGLIGLGYTIGPSCGLLGLMLADRTGSTSWIGAWLPAWLQAWTVESWVVAVTWLLIAIGAYGAIVPYRKSRRAATRRASESTDEQEKAPHQP